MSFFLRRYWNGINRRAGWLWVVFSPPLIYIILVLANPHSFVVTRDVEIGPDAPVTRSPGAATVIPAKVLVDERALFEGEQTYWALKSRLGQEFPEESRKGIPLWSVLHDELSMQFNDVGLLQVSYRGSDRRLGEFFVEFFAHRLVARSKEGRLVAAGESPNRLKDAGIRIDAAPAEIVGGVRIVERRTLVGQGRTIAVIILISLVGTVLVLGGLEWTNASFQSERQVARYLDIPVIGSLPDLETVLERLSRP